MNETMSWQVQRRKRQRGAWAMLTLLIAILAGNSLWLELNFAPTYDELIGLYAAAVRDVASSEYPVRTLPGVGDVVMWDHDLQRHGEAAKRMRDWVFGGGAFRKRECPEDDVIVLTARIEGEWHVAIVGLSNPLWVTAYRTTQAAIQSLFERLWCPDDDQLGHAYGG